MFEVALGETWPLQAFLHYVPDAVAWRWRLAVPANVVQLKIHDMQRLTHSGVMQSDLPTYAFVRGTFEVVGLDVYWVVPLYDERANLAGAEREARAWRDLRAYTDAVEAELVLATILGHEPCPRCSGTGLGKSWHDSAFCLVCSGSGRNARNTASK